MFHQEHPVKEMSERTKKRLIHPYKSPGEIHIANFLSGQLQEPTKNTTRLLSEQCPTPKIRPPSLETFFTSAYTFERWVSFSLESFLRSHIDIFIFSLLDLL